MSFIDRIEIGEDNSINFVFNNIETVNLLQVTGRTEELDYTIEKRGYPRFFYLI